jgi:hypothetical protein
VNLVFSLPLRRSLSTRVCSVTPSCHLISHGLLRRNALRCCRSTKATPRVQVGQTSSRNVTTRKFRAIQSSSADGLIVSLLSIAPVETYMPQHCQAYCQVQLTLCRCNDRAGSDLCKDGGVKFPSERRGRGNNKGCEQKQGDKDNDNEKSS